MKYGFFGGAFNPPTCAHLELAKKVKNEFKLDKLFFVPVGNLYQKKDLVDEKFRFEMLEILCRDCEGIEVSDLEMNLNKNLSAIEVFELINEKYKEEAEEIYFILGADNFKNLENWKESERLIKNYKYIVLERENIDLNEIINQNKLLKENKDNFKSLKENKCNFISSTKARSGIYENSKDEICKIIPQEIYEYIIKNKLYI